MQLNPYLTFNGDCEAAFTFYERALGGKLALLLKYETAPAEENLPADWPSDWKDKIMHARLELGDRVMMGSDHPSQTPTEMQRCSMQLELQDADEAARIFHALSVNGKVTMEFGPTFWALRFGTLKDQFGVPWIINCEHAA